MYRLYSLLQEQWPRLDLLEIEILDITPYNAWEE